jgi:SAM-dependent methyltransferase
MSKQNINSFITEIYSSDLIKDGSDVLEIGVGGNEFNSKLWGKKHNYFGTDLHIGEGFDYTVANVQWLDAERFSTSTLIKERPEWDVILAIQVMEHVKHPIRVFQESYDHLRNNGIFIVTMPFMYKIHESGTGDPEILENEMRDYQRLTPSGLELLYKESGFAEYYISKHGNPELPGLIFSFGKKIFGATEQIRLSGIG